MGIVWILAATLVAAEPAVSYAHFTPREDELILRMMDGRLLALALDSRQIRTIALSTDGYNSWISPSGKFGVGLHEIRDFKSGTSRSLGDRFTTDVLGFTPGADDLLLYRKQPPRFVRESAETGEVLWELADPEGPRSIWKGNWSSSGGMILIDGSGCKLIDARKGRFVPLHPDFGCAGMFYAVFDDDDQAFAGARRSPHLEVLYPFFYDLRTHQFVDIESRVDPVSLSIARDRLWTTNNVSFQERRLEAPFAVLRETANCVKRLRPKGAEWFLLGCGPKYLQAMRLTDGSMHPIGALFERFSHGVLVASPSGKKIAHSEGGKLQILLTQDLDDPAPAFIVVALPAPSDESSSTSPKWSFGSWN
jgi:hypothetical protein